MFSFLPRTFCAYVADLLWVVMLRRESQMVPAQLDQKNTYQNCHFGPIFVALLIHACAADFGVGASSLCGRLRAFFGRSLLGVPLGPLGSLLGPPWVSVSGGTR